MTRAASRFTGWFSRFFVHVFLVASTFFGMASFAPHEARAGDSVMAVPEDAPYILAPHQVTVPHVPADFTSRTNGWLTVKFPRGYEERVEALLPDLGLTKDLLSVELGRPVLDQVEVRITRDVDEMARLAPVGAPPPAYASGVAYGPLKLVLVSLVGPRGAQPTKLEETLRHELVHIAVCDALGQGSVPRWFNEGLAVKLSGELAIDRVETLKTASLSNTLIPITELDRKFAGNAHEVELAYAQSADFVRFLSRRDDHPRFVRMLDRVASGQPFESAMANAYGSDLRKLEFQWKSDLAKRLPMWSIVGSLVSVAMVVLFGLAWYKRRKRSKEVLSQWEREEAQMDEVIRQIEAATRETTTTMPPPPQKLPKVEHGGSWHTLH
jgi:hypothetical protein